MTTDNRFALDAAAVVQQRAGEYLGVGLHVRSRFTDGAAEKVQ